MRKKQIYAGMILLISISLGAYAQSSSEEALFKEAKVLIFDKKWKEAEGKLEDFIARNPTSPLFSQALYYRAKCLEEQAGKEKKALEAYQNYIQLKEKNKIFAEEAEVSIIDVSYKLYASGEKSYLREVEDRLASPNKAVRYYAAIQLSYVKEKSTAEKAIPVLERIIESENDSKLRDWAKVALLRISPQALTGIERKKDEAGPRILKIRVINEQTKRIEVSINIPWALADLAFAAISDKDREAMRRKGYDLDKIRKELTSTGDPIIEISNEGKTIRIWIE
ncbi:MAG: tetratricopeptide repeat protein [Candidatus Aminicenantales bacterium]